MRLGPRHLLRGGMGESVRLPDQKTSKCQALVQRGTHKIVRILAAGLLRLNGGQCPDERPLILFSRVAYCVSACCAHRALQQRLLPSNAHNQSDVFHAALMLDKQALNLVAVMCAYPAFKKLGWNTQMGNAVVDINQLHACKPAVENVFAQFNFQAQSDALPHKKQRFQWQGGSGK